MQHEGRSGLFMCVGGTGLSYRLVLYKTALVKAELATECTSNVNRRPQDISAYYEYILLSLVME